MAADTTNVQALLAEIIAKLYESVPNESQQTSSFANMVLLTVAIVAIAGLWFNFRSVEKQRSKREGQDREDKIASESIARTDRIEREKRDSTRQSARDNELKEDRQQARELLATTLSKGLTGAHTAIGDVDGKTEINRDGITGINIRLAVVETTIKSTITKK